MSLEHVFSFPQCLSLVGLQDCRLVSLCVIPALWAIWFETLSKLPTPQLLGPVGHARPSLELFIGLRWGESTGYHFLGNSLSYTIRYWNVYAACSFHFSTVLFTKCAAKCLIKCVQKYVRQAEVWFHQIPCKKLTPACFTRLCGICIYCQIGLCLGASNKNVNSSDASNRLFSTIFLSVYHIFTSSKAINSRGSL